MTQTEESTTALPAEVISDIIQKARGIVITDNDAYLQAAEVFKAAKTLVKEIEAFFKPLKQAQDEAKRKLLDAEKAEIAKVQPAIDILNVAMRQWNEEQERIRREEEARLRQIARQQEEERRIEEALQAEKEGDKETAEAIINEPVVIPAVVAPPTVPKVAGVATRTTWSAEVTHLPTLLKAIMSGHAPISCIEPNMTYLNGVARSSKGAVTYPGVKMVKTTNMTGARS